MLALMCAHTLISNQSDVRFSDVRKNELTESVASDGRGTGRRVRGVSKIEFSREKKPISMQNCKT